MRALTWHGKQDVRVEDVPRPEVVNPNDAVIEVTATAICGSDLHLYHGRVPSMREGDGIRVNCITPGWTETQMLADSPVAPPRPSADPTGVRDGAAPGPRRQW